MNVLYSLQHLGYVIPPQADAAWLGEAGPGPSYLDEGSGGPENDFTNRNTTFMTWNLLHLARMLKDAGAFPPTATSGPRGTPAAASTTRTRCTGDVPIAASTSSPGRRDRMKSDRRDREMLAAIRVSPPWNPPDRRTNAAGTSATGWDCGLRQGRVAPVRVGRR